MRERLPMLVAESAAASRAHTPAPFKTNQRISPLALARHTLSHLIHSLHSSRAAIRRSLKGGQFLGIATCAGADRGWASGREPAAGKV